MNEPRILKKVMFEGEEYNVFLASYVSGKMAIVLHKDDEFYQSSDSIIMSVCFEELKHGEVAIKNHDYYNGYFNFLVDEGIIAPTGKFISSGFVDYPVGAVLL